MDKTTRKCAIYVRVSKEEQHPEIQIDQLKTYAKLQNIKIAKVYIDRITGTKDSRPSLNDMIFDMRKGIFNCIIIYKLDRLGRSVKHLVTLCEEFHNKNIDLLIFNLNIDTKTPTGKLVFQILGAVAEFERELISERVKLGLRKAKNVGKRGKDKKKRKTGGYNLRYQKKGGMGKSENV